MNQGRKLKHGTVVVLVVLAAGAGCQAGRSNSLEDDVAEGGNGGGDAAGGAGSPGRGGASGAGGTRSVDGAPQPDAPADGPPDADAPLADTGAMAGDDAQPAQPDGDDGSDSPDAARPDAAEQAAACARRVSVATIPDLTREIANAMPGDCIVLKDGSYTVSAAIPIGRAGTAARPITITAETVGGVTIAGAGSFALESPSAYVTIRGFRFTNEGGLVVAPSTQRCLVTRNVFAVSGGGSYLTVGGTDNEVSYNRFENKTTSGAFLVLDEDTKGTLRPYVHHNHFLNHTYAAANGGEAIRVFSILPRVESNLLEQIHVNGEIVSVKEGGGSMGGAYRYNTFRSCTNGTFTLRYARHDVVEGNFFIDTPGIRVFGTHHRIVGNYIEGGNLVLGDGVTTGAYIGLDDVEVSFNTLVNARITGQDRGALGVAPKNLRIANNIIQVDGGEALVTPHPFANVIYEGNILWGSAAPGAFPAGGFRRVDPRLQVDASGHYHIGPDSPAIDAAVGVYAVTEDIEGKPRLRPDVGADEVSSAPPLRHRLTPADVGPDAP
jgi:poly(beta-D-mannuronate) lyase